MVHSTFSLLFFFSERAIVSQFWLFFVPAEEGVDEKWGEREREKSRVARVASLRGGSLSSPSHASGFVPRACAPPS